MKLVDDIVNVAIDGQWGTICADGFGLYEGDVICRQLGYDHLINVLSKQSFSPILLFDFQCEGDKYSASKCKFVYPTSQQNRCIGGQAAGVKCGSQKQQPGK